MDVFGGGIILPTQSLVLLLALAGSYSNVFHTCPKSCIFKNLPLACMCSIGLYGIVPFSVYGVVAAFFIQHYFLSGTGQACSCLSVFAVALPRTLFPLSCLWLAPSHYPGFGQVFLL